MSQPDPFRLDGRVALVTGGGGAIGSAFAVALVEAGACVTVAGRPSESIEAAAERIAAICGKCLPYIGDMTDPAACEDMVAQTVERFGRLDIMVNAIGGGAGKVLFPAEAYPAEAWDWIYELNVRSTLLATQAAVKAMIAAGNGGRVLNIVSVQGQLGMKAGYSA
jgi:gluconate 5-dehydrogenase